MVCKKYIIQTEKDKITK